MTRLDSLDLSHFLRRTGVHLSGEYSGRNDGESRLRRSQPAEQAEQGGGLAVGRGACQWRPAERTRQEAGARQGDGGFGPLGRVQAHRQQVQQRRRAANEIEVYGDASMR